MEGPQLNILTTGPFFWLKRFLLASHRIVELEHRFRSLPSENLERFCGFVKYGCGARRLVTGSLIHLLFSRFRFAFRQLCYQDLAHPAPLHVNYFEAIAAALEAV